MSLSSPSANWYEKKIAADEKMWIALSIVVCLIMFIWMIVWHIYGKQNPSNTTYRTTPKEFAQLYEASVRKYQIGEENAIPIVMPPADKPVFLQAQMWRWSPVLVLKKDEWYSFHLSSMDLLHGFSLQPTNINFMVYPGYDHVLQFKPTSAGEYKVVCNEFCGIGHHNMVGKIIVIENESELSKYNLKAEFINNSAPTPEVNTNAAPLTEEQLAEKGAALYKSKGCNACHSTDGKKIVGPTWKGVYGSKEIVIENGSEKEVEVVDEYIKTSILTPEIQKVKGYENLVMTTVPITEDEIKSLTAFIKSLK